MENQIILRISANCLENDGYVLGRGVTVLENFLKEIRLALTEEPCENPIFGEQTGENENSKKISSEKFLNLSSLSFQQLVTRKLLIFGKRFRNIWVDLDSNCPEVFFENRKKFTNRNINAIEQNNLNKMVKLNFFKKNKIIKIQILEISKYHQYCHFFKKKVRGKK